MLADTISAVRSGVVQIKFLNAAGESLGGGSGFISKDRLITNHHVFRQSFRADSVILTRDQAGSLLQISSAQFQAALKSGSQEASFDYAILDVSGLVTQGCYQFRIEDPNTKRIGDPIAVLGFPLEHNNLTVHQGVISSFFTSKITDFVQLDASVNAGNSGGPLIDPDTGNAIGVVTRKATGLSRAFGQLRSTIQQNIGILDSKAGGIAINGINLVQALKAGQEQILRTLGEIERQANVGVGYAISAKHLLADSELA